jgi:hypothetical protein
MLVAECAAVLGDHFKDYAILLSTGIILSERMKEQVLLALVERAPLLCRRLEVGMYFYRPPLVVYRMAEHILVAFHTTMGEEDLVGFLGECSASFGPAFARDYVSPPVNWRSYLRFMTLNVSRELGPQPLTWVLVPPTDMNQMDLTPYAISSMLSLIGQTQGYRKPVLTFHPYVEAKALGITMLFQIPYMQARGGAYDASLLLVVDEAVRGIVYRSFEFFESLLARSVEAVLTVFQTHVNRGKSDPFEALAPYTRCLTQLSLDLAKSPVVAKTPETLRDEMLTAVLNLADI